MKATRKLILTSVLVASAALAHAHPGHDLLEYGAAHTVTSPYHLLAIAGLGVALLALAVFVHDSRWRFATRYSGILSIVAALALWILQ